MPAMLPSIVDMILSADSARLLQPLLTQCPLLPSVMHGPFAAADVGQNTWELWLFRTGGGWFHPVHVVSSP